VAVLGNSFGCQVAVDLAMRHPDRVGGLVLVGPTMDPTARTAPRQILRWLGDTAREDPLQLPILVRDVHDAGPRRVVGTLAHALRDPIEDKLPWSGRRRWSRGAAPSRSCPWPGHRPLPGCSR